MDLDQEIIDRADRWEREKLSEKRRRFDAFINFLQTAGVVLLVFGFAAWGIFSIQSCNNTDDRQDLARNAAQAECMETLSEETCACVASKAACTRQAMVQCEEKLGHEVCRCLGNGAECQWAAFDTCLGSLPAETCRCMINRENCLVE